MTRELAYRPNLCKMCLTPLTRAATGRVRITCSDRCRQAMRRHYNFYGWIDPKNHRKSMNRAERVLRKIEKEVGSLAIPIRSLDPDFTLRDRLRIRLMRDQRDARSELTFCVECKMPYVHDRWHKHQVCSDTCRNQFKQYENRIWAALKRDPRPIWYEDAVKGLIRYKKFRICKHCKLVFRSQDKRRQYCSKKCKAAAYWKRRPIKQCKGCGIRYRGRQLACSKTCHQRVYKRTRNFCARCHHAIKPGSEVVPNAETRIPKGVTRRKRERPVVFCTGRCRDALGWSPLRKVCEECREAYYPSRPENQRRQRYCSTACKKKATGRCLREQREAMPRLCTRCGVEMPKDAAHQRKYCAACRYITRREIDQRVKVRARQRPISLGIPVQLPIREGALVGD